MADNETPVFVIGPMPQPDDETSVLDIRTPNYFVKKFKEFPKAKN